MPAKEPNVAWSSDGRMVSYWLRDWVFHLGHRARLSQDQINFWDLKPCDGHVEARAIECQQVLEFNRKDLLVPACVLGQLIVCDDIRTDLFWGEIFEADCWNLAKTEQLRCFDSAVAGNNAVL